jgi:hypothetical protein
MCPYLGVLMKLFFASVLFIVLSLTSVFVVNAQAAETIWIQTSSTSYKTGETVKVSINAVTATPIQGLSAQIRYDPACLLPVNATSPVSGMNGLALPQVSGLADISFASTTPQTANGVLAEVQFSTVKGCQTSLAIDTASLVIRNESGFAVPITGINIDKNPIALNIDSVAGNPQAVVSADSSTLPLAPTVFPEPTSGINFWIAVFMVLFIAIAIATVIFVYKMSRK